MKAFLGFALGIITVGVFLIAYGVLVPRVGAATPTWGDSNNWRYPGAQPTFASERVDLSDRYFAGPDQYGVRPSTVAYPVSAPRTSRTFNTSSGSASSRSARLERARGRDWLKTAMVIGGSSAAGAGLGGIFGGKKGALIGAAIGGGASSLYEAKRK